MGKNHAEKEIKQVSLGNENLFSSHIDIFTAVCSIITHFLYICLDFEYSGTMARRFFFFMAIMALVASSCNRQLSKAHVFNPMQCDSIDFVIEGILSEGADLLIFDERPYTKKRIYPVNDGKFSIKVRQPLYKFLQIEDENNGKMIVIVDSVMNRVVVDFNNNTLIEGSPINKRLSHYQQISDSIYLQMDELDSKEGPEYEELNERILETDWQFIKENRDNMIPVYILSLLGQYGELTPDQLTECMNEDYVYTHHPDMKTVWLFYWAMQKRLPGQKYHDIELADTEGIMHNLSEYVGHGNYVLLDFWASWCGPCMRSMPMMKELYDKYSDHGLQIIGISLDDSHDNWVSAIKRKGLPWIHLSDLKRWKSVAADVYGVRAIPEIVLISPKGEIIATGLHNELLKAKLEEIFTNK